ncbi:MAG TPA: hypothetical protein VF922_06515 [Bradyrhizobium sp.]
MAKSTDHLARSFEIENTGGLLSDFLAEEDELDRSALWRLGSWGAASVGAVIVALLASQSSIGWRRDQVVVADLVRQSQQIQALARESQNETRRLASAIDTLNSDRDRLYSRVTVLEQGLDSVTGAIARQNSAPAAATVPLTAEIRPVLQSPASAPAPAASPVATVAPNPEKPRTALPEQAEAGASSPAQGTANAPAATPSTPLMASKSIMAQPDSAAGKLIEPDPVTPPRPEAVASAAPGDNPEPNASQAAAAQQAVQRTEFGVDVGGANSLNGLRALWRGLLKSKSTASLATMRPIIVVKESNTGLGMQLRLVAGPLNDAAAAAKICAALVESQRTCETAVFDGQRLAIKADEPAASEKPAAAKPVVRRRRATTNEDASRGSPPSMLSSVFGGR